MKGVSDKKACDGLVVTDRLGKYKCGKHVYTSRIQIGSHYMGNAVTNIFEMLI